MRLVRWILFTQLALGTVALAQQDTMPPLPPLTDPPTGEHLPGKFVWADLFSSDTEKSRSFYEQVFGWEWKAVKQPPKPYGIFYLDEMPVAGLAHRASPDDGDDYGRWVHYISAKDVAATEKAVLQRKGRALLSHRSFADRGDFAILGDLESVPFGIMRSSSGDPGDYRAEPGEWIWHELFTRDTEQAIRFYSELFGYEPQADSLPTCRGWHTGIRLRGRTGLARLYSGGKHRCGPATRPGPRRQRAVGAKAGDRRRWSGDHYRPHWRNDRAAAMGL